MLYFFDSPCKNSILQFEDKESSRFSDFNILDIKTHEEISPNLEVLNHKTIFLSERGIEKGSASHIKKVKHKVDGTFNLKKKGTSRSSK